MLVPTIDRYQIIRPLGQGGMGKVFLAHDPKLEREVAIKVLASDAPQDRRDRFRLEARAIAALKHPNIIELYDYSGPEAQLLYLVLEYVPGRDLFMWAAEPGIDELTALCIGHELALALEHAHAHQVVHRDIKPENVLLHMGRVVLTDFGAVKAFATSKALKVSEASPHTESMGTPGFMAPEQFEGREIGPHTDLFGLGATLYNIVTGKLPYSGGSPQELYDQLKAGRYVDASRHHHLLSPDFCKLLARLLAPRPKDRFPNATALLEETQRQLQRQLINDVRQHLIRYQESPKKVIIEQREKEAEELLKELKVALKDKDAAKVRVIIKRLEKVAPLDKRARDISGVSLAEAGLQPVRSLSQYRRLRAKWWTVGFLAGAGVGAALAWLRLAA